MALEKYYEDELRYLYESGKEFARAHPDRAQFLNIDAVGDRDPYVERLFEGFAFLAARIREKLDDSLPELTEGLINLMWPQLLQDIPSTTMVQFQPRPGMLQETRVVERWVEVLTNPVGPDSTVCRFSTTQEVKLNPISLRSAEKTVDTRGNATFTFNFEVDPKAPWKTLVLDPVRLYIHAEMPTALSIHEFLTGRVTSASVSVNDGQMCVDCDPASACLPGGLSPQESLLPNDQRAFWGWALLMEYFAYPEKFLFVDLCGASRIPTIEPGVSSLTYTFTCQGDLPADRTFSADNFRLFCSPAVNLFKADAEPLTRTGEREEYKVVGDAARRSSVAVHNIISVTGIDRVTGERTSYEPLYTFRNLGSRDGRTYAINRRISPDGMRDLFLSISGSELKDGSIQEESLSIHAWCGNGALAREEVRENGINSGGRGFPDFVMVGNITRPTLPCHPPERDDFLWTFLAHQAIGYTSLAEPQRLKRFLKLYDWSNREANAVHIEAITDAGAEPVEKTVLGNLIRGVKFTVGLQASKFNDTGDIHLFGQILKESLSHYVSINNYLDLEVVLKPSGQRMLWDWKAGKQWQI